MHLVGLSFLLLGVFHLGASQSLTHPPLPNPVSASFDSDLEAYLSPRAPKEYTITPWTNTSIIPQACWVELGGMSLNPMDIEVSDIKYPDCNKAWTICRHRNVIVSWDDIAQVGSFAWTSPK